MDDKLLRKLILQEIRNVLLNEQSSGGPVVSPQGAMTADSDGIPLASLQGIQIPTQNLPKDVSVETAKKCAFKVREYVNKNFQFKGPDKNSDLCFAFLNLDPRLQKLKKELPGILRSYRPITAEKDDGTSRRSYYNCDTIVQSFGGFAALGIGSYITTAYGARCNSVQGFYQELKKKFPSS